MGYVVNATVANSTIFRNHMFADILHNNVRSDVNAALLAAEKHDSAAINDIEYNLKEHSFLFLEALDKNNKLITENKTHKILLEILPIVHDYIAVAASVLQKAKSDSTIDMHMMNDFRKKSSLLDSAMESLRFSIESDAEKLSNDFSGNNEDCIAIILLAIWGVGAVVMMCIPFSVVDDISGLRKM